MAYHAITNQEYGTSKISGAETITLTIFDIETRDEYRSYIDASMKNFNHWADIIMNPNKGFVITGLKEKRNYGRYKHDILNADCEPVIVKEFADIKDMERRLRQQWAKQDFAKTPFGKLFDQEDDK
jgi:hypothetical protein